MSPKILWQEKLFYYKNHGVENICYTQNLKFLFLSLLLFRYEKQDHRLVQADLFIPSFYKTEYNVFSDINHGKYVKKFQKTDLSADVASYMNWTLVNSGPKHLNNIIFAKLYQARMYNVSCEFVIQKFLSLTAIDYIFLWLI